MAIAARTRRSASATAAAGSSANRWSKFPGIFRGVLEVRARTVTDGMALAAVDALAPWDQSSNSVPKSRGSIPRTSAISPGLT